MSGWDKKKLDRKEFFSSALSVFRGFGPEPTEATVKSVRYLRPPGAVEEKLFQERCTRCGDCVTACHQHSIINITSGPTAGTPAIDPTSKPCYVCSVLVCAEACETGALIPIEREKIRMGTAVLDRGLCLNYRGESCTRCYQWCPFPDSAITRDHDKIFINAEHCVGCGLCLAACPTTPKSIQVFPLSEHA